MHAQYKISNDMLYLLIIHVLPGKKCAVKHEDVQISKLPIDYATKHMVCINLHNITSGYLLNRLISFNYQ